MSSRSIAATAFASAGLALSLGGCGDDSTNTAPGLPQGSEPVHLDPGEFSTRIDYLYCPMKHGRRWVSRETDPEGIAQQVVVSLTDETKMLASGIEARVVRDVVNEGGEPIE